MEIKVKLNHLRISPRKVRQIVDAIRGKKALEALTFLQFVVRKPGQPVMKLLKSGIATAQHDFQLDPENLYISQIFANEGPKLKRYLPVSRGTAHPIWKRTSHVVLVLNEIKPTPKKELKKKIAEVKEEVKKETEEKEAVSIKTEKPKFEKQEVRKQKGPSALRRMFQRKSI